MNHAFTVEPGAEFPVMAGGDFVFCNFAAHDIRVIIQDSPRTMRAGSKWRPAGGFVAGDLIVKNPDPVNPVAVVLTIGTGDFDDQIIRGEVTVNPGIRNAAGQFVADNRHTVDLMASLTSRASSDYDLGDPVFEFVVPDSGSGPDHSIYGVEMVGRDEIWVTATTADAEAQTIRIFSRSGRELGQIPMGPIIGGSKPVDGIEYNPLRDTVFLMNRDAQLTEITRGGVVINQVSLASQLPNGFAAGDATGLAFLPERNELAVVAPIDNTLRIIDASTLQAAGSFDLGDYADGDVSTWRGQWFVSGTGTGFDGLLNPSTGEIVNVGAQGGNAEAVSVWARENLAVYANDLTVTGRVIEPVTFYGRGSVQDMQCGGGLVLTQPGDAPIRAEIYTHLKGSQYVATGEIIRAVLEIWGGAPVTDDYLDHVFGIEFPADAINLQTGAETFARAGVRDAFTVGFPGRVRLTIDNGIEWVK